MKTKDLILVRGCSGSGKSTFAELVAGTNYDVLAADDYHMVNGEYRFDVTKIKDAHVDCRNRAEKRMKHGDEKVVVANTFTREWEMTPYFELAEKYEYRVFTIVVENRHGGVNVHDVPTDVLVAQKERFEFKL